MNWYCRESRTCSTKPSVQYNSSRSSCHVIPVSAQSDRHRQRAAGGIPFGWMGPNRNAELTARPCSRPAGSSCMSSSRTRYERSHGPIACFVWASRRRGWRPGLRRQRLARSAGCIPPIPRPCGAPGRMPRSLGAGRMTARTRIRQTVRYGHACLRLARTTWLPPRETKVAVNLDAHLLGVLHEACWTVRRFHPGNKWMPTSKNRSRLGAARSRQCAHWGVKRQTARSCAGSPFVGLPRARSAGPFIQSWRNAWRLPATNNSVVVDSCGSPFLVQPPGVTFTVRLPTDSRPTVRASPSEERPGDVTGVHRQPGNPEIARQACGWGVEPPRSRELGPQALAVPARRLWPRPFPACASADDVMGRQFAAPDQKIGLAHASGFPFMVSWLRQAARWCIFGWCRGSRR